jgi:DNA-binding transcriptional MerR regulator
VSKVRFLEGQGLIRPERSESGYRLFSEADVSRLRYVLREQRDNYLPLKVIKSKLSAWESGDEPVPRVEAGPPPESYFAASGVSMTGAELARATGLTEQHVADLRSNDVFRPLELDDGEPVYRDDDLAIGRAAFRLIAQGLEIRHIRTLRLAADRESDLVQQLASPLLRHRNPANRRRAAEILADCAQAGGRFHEGIVRARLRELLEER